MIVEESQIKQMGRVAKSIADCETASLRSRLEAHLVLSRLESLHACLCCDHLPADQHSKNDVEFDLSKDIGRKLL
tara:strand:+ start:117800 stop:118024 length:225 start_codon:yes stop_codon:yes gene_type:complete